ncbi:DUF2264 domain-containing protein [Glaciecola sp. 1036]|uniref:DUF2264 domain-containing protein n=1 Tax=Alteromonadaceae TaxID=72275 RepID=UPI003D02029D
MQRREFLTFAGMGALLSLTGLPSFSLQAKNTPKIPQDYDFFVGLLEKIADPVLSIFANQNFHKKFPLQVPKNGDGRDQRVAYLECFGRTIAGAAPWIALNEPGPYQQRRLKMRENALQCYEYSVDPKSPDYLDWDVGHGQMLVDSAYYTQAMIRAPLLWQQQSNKTKQRIIKEIKSLRKIQPPYTNWLLFAAMNEAFLMSIDEEYDPIRLDYAIRKFKEWYVGDGWFADGQHFAFDYYGSYVIHPMLLDILEVMANKEAYFWKGDIKVELDTEIKRSQRFCEHLERLISPTGTYPPIGRSLTYRTAAFQPLAQLALKNKLPDSLPVGQVRAALKAVHETIFVKHNNFSEDGFLKIGFTGANIALSDWYSNNGSMYITTASFLPLGLPLSDLFWQSPSEDWTQKKAFAGEAFKKDYPVEY